MACHARLSCPVAARSQQSNKRSNALNRNIHITTVFHRFPTVIFTLLREEQAFEIPG
jgi:hypothetical protein